MRRELLAAAKDYPPARGLIGWVDARLQPVQRLADIEAELARKPRVQADLPRLVADYLLIHDERQRQQNWGQGPVQPLRANAPMAQWIEAMQSARPITRFDEPEVFAKARKAAIASARQHGQRSHAPLWLMPLLLVAGADTLTAEEAAAALAAPPESPAYQTVRYHLARLALEQGHAEQAEPLVKAALAKPGADTASRNRWRGLQVLTATSLQEFLLAGRRKVVDEQARPLPIPDEVNAADLGSSLTGDDFHLHLGRDLPLKTLAALARSLKSGDQEKYGLQSLSEMVWRRAHTLGNAALADEFVGQVRLPSPELRALYSAAKTPEAR